MMEACVNAPRCGILGCIAMARGYQYCTMYSQSIAIDVDRGPWRGPEMSLEAVVTDLERDSHSHENPTQRTL